MIEGWTTETYLKNLCISLPAMYYQVDQQIGLSQKYNKMYYDQDVHDQKFELGDEVIVKNYHHEGPWTANWVGPYTVTDKNRLKTENRQGNGSTLIKLNPTNIQKTILESIVYRKNSSV